MNVDLKLVCWSSGRKKKRKRGLERFYAKDMRKVFGIVKEMEKEIKEVVGRFFKDKDVCQIVEDVEIKEV